MAVRNFDRYLVRKPAYEVGVQAVGLHKGHQVPSTTYMICQGKTRIAD